MYQITELQALGVPAISPQSGLQDLLLAYARWRDEPRPTQKSKGRA